MFENGSQDVRLLRISGCPGAGKRKGAFPKMKPSLYNMNRIHHACLLPADDILMKNCDKFFKNEECRYFPCHEKIASKTFNCLFCYCPLYMLGDRCGGNFKYIGKSKKVKCCSQCTFPHEPHNYDLVIAKLNPENTDVSPKKREKKDTVA